MGMMPEFLINPDFHSISFFPSLIFPSQDSTGPGTGRDLADPLFLSVDVYFF